MKYYLVRLCIDCGYVVTVETTDYEPIAYLHKAPYKDGIAYVMEFVNFRFVPYSCKNCGTNMAGGAVEFEL